MAVYSLCYRTSVWICVENNEKCKILSWKKDLAKDTDLRDFWKEMITKSCWKEKGKKIIEVRNLEKKSMEWEKKDKPKSETAQENHM